MRLLPPRRRQASRSGAAVDELMDYNSTRPYEGVITHPEPVGTTD
ncbi:hypothetical protein [Breoghania sp.]|nr:hypothetical protein [Breoghania sp.]MDJ0929723.1 hypothetical protein [Breoghania sp.]